MGGNGFRRGPAVAYGVGEGRVNAVDSPLEDTPREVSGCCKTMGTSSTVGYPGVYRNTRRVGLCRGA